MSWHLIDAHYYETYAIKWRVQAADKNTRLHARTRTETSLPVINNPAYISTPDATRQFHPPSPQKSIETIDFMMKWHYQVDFGNQKKIDYRSIRG